MKQSKTNTRLASKPLALDDEWNGLVLDHEELVRAVNGVRLWFNSNVGKWATDGQLGGNALVIAGPYGNGKSHIAHVVRRIVGRQHCVFWEEPQLVSALWESYKDGTQVHERYIYNQARSAPIFILDDLGTAPVKSEGWLQALYWHLFSYNPLNGRGGILITTNQPWLMNDEMPFAQRIGQRALSRLMHQLGGHNPKTNRPQNWFDIFNVRDRRFDYQGITGEKAL